MSMNQGFLRKTIGGWRLESKCLLLLGLALVASILLAFSVVQVVATRLVLETTRQTARDVAKSHLFGEHAEVYAELASASKNNQNNLSALRELRKEMLATGIAFELLRLDDRREYEDLAGTITKSDVDSEKLREIADAMKTLDDERAIEDFPENESTGQTSLETSLPSLTGPRPSDQLFQEHGPVGDYYYYYHPVAFKSSCLDCHAPNLNLGSQAATGEMPFRVLRVKMPYSETRLWKIWSYSILIAVGLGTLALSLFFIHWILHRLVIRPLHHLRQVSDDVSKGNLELRSEIDSDDEFQDLSDAFNRMLRHFVETQAKVNDVNKELDTRVDQLAQLNLQLYEANRLKSDFLANMSHELRTPLNSILGFSEVLQGFDTLTEKQKRYAGNIQKSGRLLLEMINDILDLAKVEAGKMEVRPTQFDLVALVEGQCDVVRSLAEDKNIDLRIEQQLDDTVSSQANDEPVDDHESGPNMKLSVTTDQAKIQQILTNLLSNAIKFTPQGGMITVTIGLVDSDFFRLTITDTGVGIAESDHEAIFEKFRQVHVNQESDSLTREYSGTGLGLSIVRELCRLLGGEITLHSQLGKGSTFSIALPRNYARSLEPIPEASNDTSMTNIVDATSKTRFSYP
jgi:two-component system, NarL family, sensor histidine kinase BarA